MLTSKTSFLLNDELENINIRHSSFDNESLSIIPAFIFLLEGPFKF